MTSDDRKLQALLDLTTPRLEARIADIIDASRAAALSGCEDPSQTLESPTDLLEGDPPTNRAFFDAFARELPLEVHLRELAACDRWADLTALLSGALDELRPLFEQVPDEEGVGLLSGLDDRGRAHGPPPEGRPAIVFVLSTARSGSTLLRVMLGGHSAVFSPPELTLAEFTCMAERQQALGPLGIDVGLVRAIAEADGITGGEAAEWVEGAVEQKMSTRAVYEHLIERCAPRIVVDKTPPNAREIETLRRCEAWFGSRARYIHLHRHPYAMIASYARLRLHRLEASTPGGVFDEAEREWVGFNRNIMRFMGEVEPGRCFSIAYEQLVRAPEANMIDLCAFLGLRYEDSSAEPYDTATRAQRMMDGPGAVGDHKIRRFESIDPSRARACYGVGLPRPLTPETRALAEALGYRLR